MYNCIDLYLYTVYILCRLYSVIRITNIHIYIIDFFWDKPSEIHNQVVLESSVDITDVWCSVFEED